MIRKYDKNQSKYKNAIWLEGLGTQIKRDKRGRGESLAKLIEST